MPLRADVAAQFKLWYTDRNEPLGAKVFPNFNARKGADMLKVDLEAVGIPYKDEAGKYADFHALRHTFISRVVESGASVRVAQELARHSTPTLTIGRYSHTRIHDLSKALDSLPAILNCLSAPALTAAMYSCAVL